MAGIDLTHRCAEEECCYFRQATHRNCGCHKTEMMVAVELIAELAEAVKPFSDCCDQISATESDEEWAKFRLLIGDYRRAHAAFEKIKGRI